jgi:hypothetical protein
VQRAELVEMLPQGFVLVVEEEVFLQREVTVVVVVV